ncbi:hypothetical protein PHAVU_001G151800 [Phaseolus vulgaris]|uniref:Uncharacterized protein n=1 Tax=Phaseolus vulgaris TaxID=3885 RepID=V7CYF8_PHAVU|nr:hypothetical protein PHAVU_001G151800g [Phaseolus vulgaris]ESW34428.1 hypothetical protein PHAVU_001G151800g [Phaseolus vulgaris]
MVFLQQHLTPGSKMAATRSQLCAFVVVAFIFISTPGQKTPCIFAETQCVTNNDCDAPCKLKLPKNLYCPDSNICDNGNPQHTVCCCRQIPHCSN